MNNDDNKQTKDQSTQHDNLSEHECSAEHNTQQSSEGDTNSHFQTEHATNTDETHSAANNTANKLVVLFIEKTFYNLNTKTIINKKVA